MRHDFTLGETDRAFLESREKPWQALLDGQNRWVIVEGFDVPAGYNHSVSSVALVLPPSYPDTQIDMAYFFPELARVDGKPIRALSPRQLDGKSWQQWSRHRVGDDAWRAGSDNIETHLRYVTAFLQDELRK